MTPEQIDGEPAASVTGVAYYLIHHLRDNDRAAKLSAPTLPAQTDPTGGAKLLLTAPSQTVRIDLSNSSRWLDLIPVVKARVNDAGSAWNLTFKYHGQDITTAVRSPGGFCFYKADRLSPSSSKTISLTVASRSGQVSSAPLDISVELLPHPTTTTVSQTLRLRNFAP